MRMADHCLRCLLAAATTLCLASLSHAAYPERAIQIVVPFAAGSPPDVLARALADGWKRAGFAEAVVVNQPGAGGSIAVAQLTKAPPDGYTLAIAGDAALVVNPWLYPSAGFSPLRDITPVSQLVVTPTVLIVGKGTPARSVGELVDAARRSPGALSFASAGAGTSSRRNGELLRLSSRTEWIHVPYKNSALPDVAEGRVTMFFANAATIAPFIADGRLRPLAVAAPERLARLPDVPTMAEAGFAQVDSPAWFGLIAPPGLPNDIAERLRAAAESALRDPSAAARVEALGGRVVVSGPAAFRALIADELPRWREFVREARIEPD
jgi:tripartite-type tricarboxylate transporter receptor subunit TctC